MKQIKAALRAGIAILLIVASMHSAAAASSIDNQAQVTFQSATTATPTTLQSNTVHVISPAADNFSITSDQNIASDAGLTITLKHKLTNTGSVAADFKLSAANLASNTFTFTQIAIYQDVNGNGVVDAGDVLLNSNNAVTVAANSSLALLVQATIPAGINPATMGKLLVSAVSVASGSTQSNTDSITIAPPPQISYYTDNTFSNSLTITHAGSPLFLQASGVTCNQDAAVAEKEKIKITSSLTGDVELVDATETGVNTSLFQVNTPVPTRDATANPAVAGNGTMEVLVNDVLTAVIVCGNRSASAIVTVDPTGVVFDSRSNAPVAGATVTLVDVSGQGNGNQPNGPAVVLAGDGKTSSPSTVVTGSDGSFRFPQIAASSYRLMVTPPNGYAFPSKVAMAQLPARHIDAAGSYGNAFAVSAAQGTVTLDVPLDTTQLAGLFVQKTASRTVVEIGDFVDYEVKVKNNTGYLLNNATIQDILPRGFSYELKSSKRDAVKMADPDGGKGPMITFHLGDLDKDQQVSVTYRVKVGAGAQSGDSFNKAQAFAGNSSSNVAVAKVTVQGGVFSDQGFITGKVYIDSNGNKLQDAGEPGFPGIRVYLEDGTFAISDVNGMYSFYGVSARTHVLKLDLYTLPVGAELVSSLTTRGGADNGSQFVDMKFGELHKTDFILSLCSVECGQELQARRQKLQGVVGESEVALKTQLVMEQVVKSQEEVRAQAASGLINGASIATVTDARTNATTTTAPSGSSALVSTGRTIAAPASTSADEVKEEASAETAALKDVDNSLGFMDLKDQQVMPLAQTNVLVKGLAGAKMKVRVNGVEVPATRVGRKSVLESKQLQIWEFVGVGLTPGQNTVTVAQIDSFGNERESRTIHLVAPDQLGKLVVEIARNEIPADGQTRTKVVVKLTDGHGVPVTTRTQLTLESAAGHWEVKDLNEREPGTQVFIQGGQAEFFLVSPMDPAQSLIRVSSGDIKTEAKIAFVPELRPMMAAGVTEYVLDFSKLSGKNVQNATLQDGFEQTLKMFSRTDGSVQSAAHTAVTLKGKVKGSYLLTLAYDSDKTTRDRLFRDIQPDQFYPLYGDSSVRGYDAQSSSRMYVRVDKGKSYTMFGDYTTSDTTYSQSLGNYSRSLNGFKQHYENSRVSVTGFASRDTLRQIVEEIPANGTSGPYVLANSNGVENSEKVEIIVRDRNQPSLVIKADSKTRFVDYEFEPLTGRLLMKAPVPTFDSFLNAISIRVTYEVDQAGEAFWLGGANGQWRASNRLQLGASVVDDSNPQDPNRLYSMNSVYQLGAQTLLSGEVARTMRDSIGIGNGYRVEIKHVGDHLQGRLFFGHTDAKFNNPVAALSQGRGEWGLKGSYKIDDRTKLVTEVLSSQDVSTGGNRAGGEIAVERSLPGNMQMQMGFRHAQESTTPATAAVIGVAPSGATPNESSSLVTKLSAQLPHFSKATLNAEYDQDVTDYGKKMTSVGGSYQITPGGRAYLRHEFISSLGSSYSLNNTQSLNSTVFGVDSNVVKDTHLFSEYRDRNVLEGREMEAAIGLRNNWNVARGLVVSSGLEKVNTISGLQSSSMALTSGLEFSRSKVWRGSERMEWRQSTSSNSFLNTVGMAAKVGQDFTLLGRNILTTTTNKGTAVGSRTLDRAQMGFAFRQTATNRWNVLNMVEFKLEKDSTNPSLPIRRQAIVFSSNLNYQANAKLTLSSRYATKFAVDDSNTLASNSATHLFSTRATYDLAKRWDMGFTGSTTFSNGFRAQQYGAGAEVGYLVAGNLWISAGYNVFGFRDADLVGDEITRRGPYIRFRFKFDESLFGRRDKTAGQFQSHPESKQN